MARDDAPDTDRSTVRSAPSTDAFAMLVQLTQETRDDVKHIRTRELPEIRDRLTRLEAGAAPRSGWAMPVKAGAGVAAIVPVFYALIQLAQSVGWLPPPAPGASPPAALVAPAP